MLVKPNTPRKETRFHGFTLVELIVVITILAILATVGFLALSGYTQDAKDSAIKANVRSLQTAITSEAAITNNSPRYYVVHDADYALSGAFAYVDGASVALTGGDVGSAPLDSNYTAGKPDFKKLKLNPEKFRISASGLPGGTMGVIARATGFGSDSAEASYDAGSLMAAGADFTTAGTNGKRRIVSYVQAWAVAPATKVAVVTGNFPTSNAQAGTVSWLLRAEPGSATNLTGALVDGAAGGSAPSSTPNSCAAPAIVEYSWSTGSIAVPAGCTTVVAKLWGGGGGGGKSGTTLRQGGGGGYAETAAIPVSWTLYYVVGGGGGGGCIDSTLCGSLTNVAGGFGGGGNAMQGNGGGGGTFLASASTFAQPSLIAAAGGGGWAGTSTTLTVLMQWGAGGGNAWNAWDANTGRASAPGNQAAWGMSAYSDYGTVFAAMSGSYMKWGSTKTATNSNYASGGGGGYHGGGSGGRQGGWIHTAWAGGSGYVIGGNGTLVSGTADKPGNQSDSYATNAGTLFGEGGGTNHNNGNNGRLVLIWGN